MCLISFALEVHDEYPLILIANRDEFYERPTAPVHEWGDQPVIGGRDLKANGTWMGVSRDGKFAAVTNYRDLKNLRNDAKSRGALPVNFLTGNYSAASYLQEVDEQAGDYNGFNLLTFDGKMYHYSNYEGKINQIDKGVHGLSNALLNTPWTKVNRIKDDFARVIDGRFDPEDLLALLADESTASDDQLPFTGVPLELERALSAICIRTEKYGTCCSTAVLFDRAGNVNFTERTYPVGSREDQTSTFQFKIA